MNKPCVLHLVGSFHQGGSEAQALQLVRLLRESGNFDVHLATLDRSGPLLEAARNLLLQEIPDYPLTSFYDWNMLVQLRRLRKLLRERRVSVLHTHDFYTNVFGMIGARLAGTPVRIASRRETGGMRTRAQKFVERAVFGFAHAVVTNARTVGRTLAAEGVSASKIVTIYNGIDPKRVQAGGKNREAILKSFGVPNDRGTKCVTIVANMRHEVKDHPTFLRAAKQVAATSCGVVFLLAGEGPLSQQLQHLAAQLGIEQQCFFLGRCNNIAEILFASDVCVLSSVAEGFPNSVLEYMAAGKPVVATDVGAVNEAVTDGVTGCLVSAGDDQAMAKRITELLGDPARASAMGAEGKRIAEERFSPEAQLRNTEALYERLLASH